MTDRIIDRAATPLIELERVTKTFPVKGGILQRTRSHVQAVSDVSITVARGETLGLVGESGSGKSTLGRLALRLIDPSSGTIRLDGEDVTNVGRRDAKALRRRTQMVFQDPYSSFNPLAPIELSVGEPLDVHLKLDAAHRAGRLRELMGHVGLAAHHLSRYPRELSGGQLQRLAIARALTIDPDLVVLDEPVSSLDVSTQAQIINLLERLQRERGVAYIFIAHNPALVHHASDRIAVMYLGEVVEIGDAGAVYDHPRHPYTRALLSAVTVPDPEIQRNRRRTVLQSDIPDPTNPPPGCRFHTRCPEVMDVCRVERPAAVVTDVATTVHCHLYTPGSATRAAGHPEAAIPVDPPRVAQSSTSP